MVKRTQFDVAIIGAGVVGCAAARRFALAGAKVLVLEQGADILSGASKANSGILHTGFDAPKGSLECDLIQAGRREYLEIHQRLGLSVVKTGAIVCAWSDTEAEKLFNVAALGRENGVDAINWMTARKARELMPSLSAAIVAALEIENEYVIDPWSAPLAYLTQAVTLGASVVRACELVAGRFSGSWALETSLGVFEARSVINAAGLFGDVVDQRLGFDPTFSIRPRKGQFVVLDKAAYRLVPRIVLPVPTETTKGITLCPTAFGNVLIGPTAEEQESRERAGVDRPTLEALLQHGIQLVPELAGIPVTAVYSGLRPATEEKGYRIVCRPDAKAITLGGIRSTGLSSALGLAQHALKLHAEFDCGFRPHADVPSVSVPNLTETAERDWERSGYGEIVCHCELVTRREIEAALDSPIPPTDFGGLRRRTRAGMGSCQGFFCNGRLADMTRGRFKTPLAVPCKGK